MGQRLKLAVWPLAHLGACPIGLPVGPALLCSPSRSQAGEMSPVTCIFFPNPHSTLLGRGSDPIDG